MTGGGWHKRGERVTYTAVPAPGFKFTEFTYIGSPRTENPLVITFNDSYSVQATFVPAYEVFVTSSDSSRGTVGGSGRYATGTTFHPVATSLAGYRFDRWTVDGAVPTAFPNALDPDGPYRTTSTLFNPTSSVVRVTANFAKLEPQLTASFGMTNAFCVSVPYTKDVVGVCGPRLQRVNLDNSGNAAAVGVQITDIKINAVRVNIGTVAGSLGGFCTKNFYPTQSNPCGLPYIAPFLTNAFNLGSNLPVGLLPGNQNPPININRTGAQDFAFIWPKVNLTLGNPLLSTSFELAEFQVTISFTYNGGSGSTTFWTY